MQRVRLFSLTLIAGLFLMAPPQSRAAQVSIAVNIGPAPVCPYGYFPYRPYNCAPYGYYGPSWFPSGIFIGAGPWFRGPRDFHGYVNRYYDPRYGYRGGLPRRGEYYGRWRNDRYFHGNAEYDGRGNRWNGHDNGWHGHNPRSQGWHGRGHGNQGWHGNGHGNGNHGNHGDHGNGHGHGHGHGHGR